MTNDWREWPRQRLILIATICTLDNLKEQGLIEGGHLQATEKARALYAEMIAAGMTFTDEEIKAAMKFIRSRSQPETVQ